MSFGLPCFFFVRNSESIRKSSQSLARIPLSWHWSRIVNSNRCRCLLCLFLLLRCTSNTRWYMRIWHWNSVIMMVTRSVLEVLCSPWLWVCWWPLPWPYLLVVACTQWDEEHAVWVERRRTPRRLIFWSMACIFKLGWEWSLWCASLMWGEISCCHVWVDF